MPPEDALGNIPEEAQACLKSVGEWMKVNGEIIYNSQRSMLTPEWGECIRKDSKNSSTLYLCVFDWSESGELKLNCNYGIKKVTFMSDQSILKYKTKDNIMTIDISDKSPDKTVTIIKVDLKKKLPAIKLIQNSQKTFKIEDV